jgi:hypothetical protein
MSSACYTVRSMYHFSSLNTLKMVYFAYFHSIMKRGIIFWGNSTESKRVFQLWKKIWLDLNLELLANHYFNHWRYWHYLRKTYYPQWNFCHIIWKFIHLTFQFMVLTREINCNCINWQQILLYQKGTYYMSTQIFNELPEYTAELLGDKNILYQLWKST